MVFHVQKDHHKEIWCTMSHLPVCVFFSSRLDNLSIKDHARNAPHQAARSTSIADERKRANKKAARGDQRQLVASDQRTVATSRSLSAASKRNPGLPRPARWPTSSRLRSRRGTSGRTSCPPRAIPVHCPLRGLTSPMATAATFLLCAQFPGGGGVYVRRWTIYFMKIYFPKNAFPKKNILKKINIFHF